MHEAPVGHTATRCVDGHNGVAGEVEAIFPQWPWTDGRGGRAAAPHGLALHRSLTAKMYSIVRQQLLRAGLRMQPGMASLHTSAALRELSKFSMPAMSPTMQDGGIASWRKNEGESFNSGDVLLEIVRTWYS